MRSRPSNPPVTSAAGVSEPVLYRHFESKKALFLSVLQEIREATLQRYRQETIDVTEPLAKLHRIVDLYLGSAAAREQVRQLDGADR